MNRLAWSYPLILWLLAVGGGHRSAAQDAPEPIVQRWGIRDVHGAGPLVYHPETDRLLTAHDGGAVLWDASSGLAVRSFNVDGIEYPHLTAVDFSADGSKLLIGSQTRLQMYDSDSGKATIQYDLGGRTILDVDISPDDRFVAAACEGPAILIWEAGSGRRLHTLDEHRFTVTHVRFSPESGRLVSGGNDHLAVLWDTASGQLLHRFASPTEIRGTAFSSDGKRLLTFGSGEFWHTARVVVWDVETGQPLQVIPRSVRDAWFLDQDVLLLHPNGNRQHWPPDRHERAPEPAEFPISNEAPHHRMAISKDHWTLRLQPAEPEAALQSPGGEILPLPLARDGAELQVPLDFSADGQWLVTGGGHHAADSNCLLWDLRNGRLHRILIPGELARFDPDGSRIAIAHHQTITLFSLDSGETLQTLKVAEGAIESLQFVAAGTQLLTASGDWYDGGEGQLLLWDVQTGEPVRNYAPDDKAVLHAAMTPDESRIVASFTPANDGAAGVDQISVFDATSGERLRDLALPTYQFGRSLLDPAGRYVANEHYRREVLLWDVETLQQRHRLPPSLAAFSPDGSVLSTYDAQGQIHFWNTATGELVRSQSIPVSTPQQSLFHPGGRLYVGSTNQRGDGPVGGRSIGFWDLQNGELQAELFSFAGGREWLIRTAEGHFSGSAEGLQRVAWRNPATGSVTLDPQLTESRTRPARVGEVLSKSLSSDANLIDLLAARPSVAPAPAGEDSTEPDSPHQRNRKMREETIRAFEAAGGDVEANIHGFAKAIHMEKRPLTAELVERLAWVRSTERLYLAATGITDEQLVWVGMLGNLKRLSLWGNPISDKGLAHLATLWNLEVLDVHDTKVTAAGLNQLWLLQNLKTVIVPDDVDLDQLSPLQRLRKIEIVRRK